MFNNLDISFASFGEVLFDVFGTDRKIGGAPLNIALRIKSYGFPVAMISAIGQDDLGEELWQFMYNKGILLSAVDRLKQLPTGSVQVTLNEQGSATYDIQYPAAWDCIPYTKKINQVLDSVQVLIYGSLACRHEVSRQTLFEILEKEHLYKVFDVNLRAPFYNYTTLLSLMEQADFIKFNDDEIFEIAEAMGKDHSSLEETMRSIATISGATSICVTRGKYGAVLLWKEEFYENGGYHVQVVDTVGAGDSFLGTLLCKLLSDKDPQQAIDMACAVGSLVAASAGANPVLSETEIRELMNSTEES
ncbi:fructokinase [Neptunitalea chrysea]|uniref:Fructokinase n=1 Tax=Neptunitalea chrysea TaxID=1647581 RepID=A0A9W6B6H0_9FLAO|nr:PfkB family carbohydrate kinase [Neptunitalea chrysea]GLB53589.1 fructokinase [Neptunitalea chrysea]